MSGKEHHSPPKMALRILRWYCREDRIEEIEGDLEEFFQKRIGNGSPIWVANVFYLWNVIKCLKPYAVNSGSYQGSSSLYGSYFKLAVRHSWKNKWSVLINVAGLGVSLSLCVFVYMLYAYNMEFDSFYPKTDDVYRIHSMTFENGIERRNEISPTPLMDVMENDIAGIESVSSYREYSLTLKKDSDYFTERTAIVSENFFDMFHHPLVYGNFESFNDLPVAYLTQPLAEKYFGDEIALDKTLTIFLNSSSKLEVTVAGVLDRIPENSSFYPDIFISEKDYYLATGIDPNDWTKQWYAGHYIRANKRNLDEIEERLESYLSRQNETHEEMKITDIQLIPFRSPLVSFTHLYRNHVGARLHPGTIMIFTSLIAMIFLIACFNLANTSIALISKRLKEIGIRKTLGSANTQILKQFLFEMGITCSLAFIIAISMINVTSKTILDLFEGKFMLKDADTTGVILFIVVFLIFTTIISGLLPALYAWKFQPNEIMRKSVKLKGVSWGSKALSIVQFAFSIAVLSAGFTFSQNNDYLEQLDLGFQSKNVFELDLGYGEKHDPFVQELATIPGMELARTGHNIGGYAPLTMTKIDTSRHEIRRYNVGENYLELMEVDIINGRTFLNSEMEYDKSVLVNQEYARRFHEGNDPINSTLEIDGTTRTIVGIVKDVIDDIYADAETEPKIFTLGPDEEMSKLMVKVVDADVKSSEQKLKEIWARHFDKPYTGKLQEDLTLGYAKRDLANLRKIFLVMAFIGGFLSLTGIFSLAKLNVAKRFKEISIRKVLGATVRELMLAINHSFMIVLVLSIVLGCIIGYFVSEMVLSTIYKVYVEVSPFTSLWSGLFIVLFSILMISLAVIVPARANPVSGLRED